MNRIQAWPASRALPTPASNFFDNNSSDDEDSRVLLHGKGFQGKGTSQTSQDLG